VLFEAGALSKTIDDETRLCTLLLGGLEPKDVPYPLAIFQRTSPDAQDIRKLLSTVNHAVSDNPLPDNSLDHLFERLWPEFEQKLKSMPEPRTVVNPKRPIEEMLSALLDYSRDAAQRRKSAEWLEQYIPELQQFFPLLSQLIKAAQFPPRQVESRKVYCVKQEGSEQITKVEGTLAVLASPGVLFIYEQGRPISKFEKVTRWWAESLPSVPYVPDALDPTPGKS
jgi:hypothetical protein